ncbi:MAG: A/G-specific adenine glycosylase [Oscillospiraceae bacterium]|nr:A/G-specific adenine glycosylase [Oscillospiraceae bacterium]
MQGKLLALKEPLLRWYDENRRILPWREEVSPYRTWVSEIMLQQTRVAAVLPYFARFMTAFPTVEALAEAEEEKLLKLWEGLGYYSRVRNLQKAAKIIVEQYSGEFPRTYEALVALPGIGDYTAGAILSIACGVPTPAVDGNVLRIVARITGDEGDVMDAAVKKRHRAAIAETMSKERPGAYVQALMDLGATVCLPNGEPLCDVCPARDFCCAREEGKTAALPVRTKKKARRVEEMTVLLLIREGRVALRKRPDEGLLAALWEFPNFPGKCSEEETAQRLEGMALRVKDWKKSLHAKHIFTHVEWQMQGYALEVSGEGSDDLVWMDKQELLAHAVPSAFEKFKKEALGEERDGSALL